MKIYNILTEDQMKYIERTLINNFQAIQELGRKIIYAFPEDRLKPFDYDMPESIDFINYCRSHYDLLVSISILLKVVAWETTNEIENVIVKKIIAYAEERIKSIDLLLEILDKPANKFPENCYEIARFISELLFEMDIKLPLDEV